MKKQQKVRVRFILFYSELALTDLGCNMLQTLLGQKKYEEMLDEQPIIEHICISPDMSNTAWHIVTQYITNDRHDHRNPTKKTLFEIK